MEYCQEDNLVERRETVETKKSVQIVCPVKFVRISASLLNVGVSFGFSVCACCASF